MNVFRLFFITIVAFTFLACGSDADVQVDDSIISSKDRIFDYMRRYSAEKAPGIAYISINEKGLYYAHSAGYSRLAGATPFSLNDLVNANTASQIYTTVAILQLAEKGLVDINAPLSKYFSDHPYGNEVKIIHLLAHSSGLSNPSPIAWVHLPEEHGTFDRNASLKQAMEKHDSLKFTPGQQVSYSALGYWILGRLVEEVTGKPFESYVQAHIFQPLGLKKEELFFELPATEELAGLPIATGYLEQSSFLNFFKSFWSDEKIWSDVEAGWVVTRPHYFSHPSFGGLWGTPRAFMKIMQDFLKKKPKLLKPDTRDMMFVPWRDESGDALPIALGWRAGSLSNGDRFYFLEGGGAGFRSEFRVYPSLNMATAVLVNKTVFNSRLVLSTIDTELFNGFARKDEKSSSQGFPNKEK